MNIKDKSKHPCQIQVRSEELGGRIKDCFWTKKLILCKPEEVIFSKPVLLFVNPEEKQISLQLRAIQFSNRFTKKIKKVKNISF